MFGITLQEKKLFMTENASTDKGRRLEGRKAELTSRLLRVKSDEARQEETIRQLEEEFERINGEIIHLNETQSVIEEKLGGLHDELAGKDQQLRDAQVVYHQEKSKLDALANLTERYDGYGGSVKRVMECKEEEA